MAMRAYRVPQGTTKVITIPNPSPEARSTVIFQIVKGSGTISVTPQWKAAGDVVLDDSGIPAPAAANIAYRDHLAKTDVVAGTAITGSGVYEVEADFGDVVLSVTNGAGSDAYVYAGSGVG